MITNIFFVINIILAIIISPACLMAGLMGLSDNPKINYFSLTSFFCYLILIFPIICIICAILPYWIPTFFLMILPFCSISLFSILIYLKKYE